MKSEHRHELKTNELADWIAHFPQWVKKNLKMIIYVSVVVILVAGSYFYRRYQKEVLVVQKQLELTTLLAQLSQSKMQIMQAQAEGLDVSYKLIQLSDDLQSCARDTKNKQMAALALIKSAESLRMELHYRAGTVTEEDITAQINRAKDSYIEAIGKNHSNRSLTATAKFGLGLCEEELGNFEKARQIYREITADADLEGTAIAPQANQRLNTIGDYKQKVVFGALPKLPPTQAGQPEVEIKIPDITLPVQ